MAEMKGVGVILIAFIAVVLGSVFLVGLANSTTSVTQLNTVTNESKVLTNNTVVQLANTQLESVTRIGNASTTLTTTAYTVNLPAGRVTLSTGNASVASGVAYDISYTYRQVGDSTARSIISLLLVFFAIAVLLITIGYLSPTFREMMGFS